MQLATPPAREPTRLKDWITAKVTFIGVVNNVTATEEPNAAACTGFDSPPVGTQCLWDGLLS